MMREVLTICRDFENADINEVIFHCSILGDCQPSEGMISRVTHTVMRLTIWRTQLSPPVATQ